MKTKLLLFLLLLPVLCFGQTYTYSTLVGFPATSQLGPISPENLMIDSAGNLYGTSRRGGVYGFGAVFKVSPKGGLSTIYSFGTLPNNGDGLGPFSALVADKAGNLYGAAMNGGDPYDCTAEGCGTVFELANENGTYAYSLLYSGEDTALPQGVTLDSLGNVYAVSYQGGELAFGTVVEMTTSGSLLALLDFSEFQGADGSEPYGSVAIDSSGTVWGTTSAGGNFYDINGAFDGGYGVVYTWSPPQYNAVTLPHIFTGADAGNGIIDGGIPLMGPTQDSSGNLYGTTSSGGKGALLNQLGTGYGTVYKISSDGQYSILYEFCQRTNCADGYYPIGPLIVDASGNVYGVASLGGANGQGVVFKITPAGVITILHNGGNLLIGPWIVMDKSGNLYGTTSFGGPNNNGSIYKLTKH